MKSHRAREYDAAKSAFLHSNSTLDGGHEFLLILQLTLTGRVSSQPVPEDIKTGTEYLCESTGVFLTV